MEIKKREKGRGRKRRRRRRRSESEVKNCRTGTRDEQDALGACDKISGMCRARLGTRNFGRVVGKLELC